MCKCIGLYSFEYRRKYDAIFFLIPGLGLGHNDIRIKYIRERDYPNFFYIPNT